MRVYNLKNQIPTNFKKLMKARRFLLSKTKREIATTRNVVNLKNTAKHTFKNMVKTNSKSK